MTGIYRYVPLADVAAFRARGWTIAHDLADTHHGRWSVLMKPPGDGPTRRPGSKSDR